MTDSEFPPYLYKYRSLSSNGDVNRLREVLLDNKLYLSSPSEFNDPFDSNPVRIICGTIAEQEKYFRRLLTEHSKGETRSDQRIKAKRIAHEDPEIRKSQLKEIGRDTRKKVGVHCFAGTRDNILLWSHYADSHRGLCIRFNGNISVKPRSNALPVIYKTDRPVIDFLDQDHIRYLNNLLLTKSVDWSYEAEHRIIERDGPGHYEFSPHLLDGVIFGTETPDARREEVLDMVRQRTPVPNLFQCRIDDRHFRLLFETISL